jgi:glucokinase
VKALAVDLGGSHATCAVVEDETVPSAERISLEGALGLEGALPLIEEALARVAATAGTRTSECTGLALGFCGIVNPETGRVLSTNAKYEDAPGIDLPAWARIALGVELQIENDARLALLGERHCGAARGCDDVVMVTLGTGIGGVAMIGGRLLRGRHHQAGLLGGHLTGVHQGRVCTCGNVGCVEAEASTWALPGVCRSWPGFEESSLAAAPRLDFETLFAAAGGGDAVAAAVRDRCLRLWAAGVVSMIHAWDPEVVILGGGVMGNGEAVLPFVQDHVRRHAWTPWGEVDVRAAELGDRAALLGAVPLLAGEAGG